MIVTRLRNDESNPMTDYFSSHYCPVKAGKSVFEIVET